MALPMQVPDRGIGEGIAILLISMRIFDRRFAMQLSRTESLNLFALAAAIGVPLQSSNRRLLPTVVISIVTIILGRGIDGVVQMKAMRRSIITVELLLPGSGSQESGTWVK
jgi:uncharacterized membrane protein YcaP (DUF421 family)